MPLKGSCHCGATQFEIAEAPATCHPMHLLVLRQARGALGLLPARAVQAADRAGPRLHLPVEKLFGRASPLRHLRLRHLQRKPRMGGQQACPGQHQDRHQHPPAG